MYNMSEACFNINVVRLQLVSVGQSRGCTLMVRGPHHGSLSGVLYGCARRPIHTFGSNTDWSQALLLFIQLISCIWSTACSATPDWYVFQSVHWPNGQDHVEKAQEGIDIYKDACQLCNINLSH